jgi:hypothetical protein
MGNLVQELYDLEILGEKYAEALNRRICFNRTEVDEISGELQNGLVRLQRSIEHKIAFINKKLVRLRRRIGIIESRLQETEESDRAASAPEEERSIV